MFSLKKNPEKPSIKDLFSVGFSQFLGEILHFSPWNSSISTAEKARCTQHLLLALRRLPARPTSQGRLPPGG